MIDKSSALPAILRKAESLPPGHALDLRTYKRNRSVIIIRTGPSDFRVMEQGFEKNTFDVTGNELKKTLKTLLRREFPRSNKIRIYQLGPYDQLTDGDLKRKIL